MTHISSPVDEPMARVSPAGVPCSPSLSCLEGQHGHADIQYSFSLSCFSASSIRDTSQVPQKLVIKALTAPPVSCLARAQASLVCLGNRGSSCLPARRPNFAGSTAGYCPTSIHKASLDSDEPRNSCLGSSLPLLVDQQVQAIQL